VLALHPGVKAEVSRITAHFKRPLQQYLTVPIYGTLAFRLYGMMLIAIVPVAMSYA
jgi:hypothetical protein